MMPIFDSISLDNGERLNEQALSQLFTEARTFNGWRNQPVPNAAFYQLWELAKFAPTAVNGMPARMVIVVTPEGKERLRPCLAPGNVEKVIAAPATVIVGYDPCFWELLPGLFPHADAQAYFKERPEEAELTAFRNSTLQGAWFMMAARALGLDCGPMSGFDAVMVDEAFFKGTTIRSNFLCNIGYGDKDSLYPRLNRLTFEEACTFA